MSVRVINPIPYRIDRPTYRDPTRRITLPLSPGVRVGNVVYVSGQVELDAPDITGQATGVLKKVQAAVEAAGATMAKVDKCTVFLTR